MAIWCKTILTVVTLWGWSGARRGKLPVILLLHRKMPEAITNSIYCSHLFLFLWEQFGWAVALRRHLRKHSGEKSKMNWKVTQQPIGLWLVIIFFILQLTETSTSVSRPWFVAPFLAVVGRHCSIKGNSFHCTVYSMHSLEIFKGTENNVLFYRL